MDLCCLTRVELQLPASEFPPTCALFLLSKAQPNNAIVNPPQNLEIIVSCESVHPRHRNLHFFIHLFPPCAHMSSVKILQFYKCQNFTILQESKILQFYKCQKFYNSTSVKILQFYKSPKFYNFTGVKILPFSSLAQPQSKCLHLLR
jgi:hypothetical protein